MTPNNKQLKDAGLKITSPRIKILQYLQTPECQHISAEELYKKLLDQGDEIGLATVYRVLNQFDDAGIVTRHHFEGGKSVFELAHQEHHDHLVCLQCGKVVEFFDPEIERRQNKIAAERGFAVKEHALYLYAECTKQDCPGQKHCPMKAECGHVGQNGECPPMCPEVHNTSAKRR